MGGFSANTNNQPSGSDVVFASNVDFSGQANPASTMLTNGQLLIGSTALNAGNTHINIGTITSPDGSITIGYNSPNITLVNTGGLHAVDSFTMQTGSSPVVPDANGLVTFNGSRVAAGTNPVRTNGTASNTMQLEVQTTQAIAATDATKVGMAAFDSAGFDVDASGFVSLNNIVNPATYSVVFDDFIYSLADQSAALSTSWAPYEIITSGSGAGITITQTNAANHPGIIKFTSTKTAGIDYILSCANTANYGPAAGNYAMTFEFMAKIDVLSAANPSYVFNLGCWDNGASGPGQGYYFKYTHGTNSGNWQMLCTDGGGTATANSSTAADTNWHRFKITVNAAGTSVGFFIDDVQLANSPVVTHISTNQVAMNFLQSNVAGATQKSFNFDYFYSKFTFNR